LEQELLQRHQKLQQEENVLAECQNLCQQQQEALVASEGQRLASEALRMWQHHYHTLEVQVQRQHDAVSEAAQACAATQQEVIAARQKKKMLEQIADAVQQRYALKMARYEQQQLDDIANVRSPHGC
jgi:flagellar export protein FliJ